MRHILFIGIFSSLFCFRTFSQSTDSAKAFNIHAPYKLSGYAFFDFIRVTGVGVDYRVLRKLEVDAQFAAFYRHGLASIISANDYFDNTGFCVALKTKFFTGRRRHFYIGTYSAINNYGYKNRWEVPDNTDDADAIRLLHLHELRDKHVNSLVGLGLSLGLKQYIKNKWNIEEFLVIASEQGGQVHEKIYSTNQRNYYTNNQLAVCPFDIYYKINRSIYPEAYHPIYHGYTIIMNVGIKIGYKLL